jgi:hypothetical protein
VNDVPQFAGSGSRPRCRCGVYKWAHREDRGCQNYRKASTLRLWLMDHSIWQHVAAPAWLRVPEKWRWWTVDKLNRSQQRCWSTLVSDAMTHREDDACDTHVPSLRGGEDAARCKSVCDWFHPDHAGQHACACYCGKFQFTASDGLSEREQARITSPEQPTT